MGNIEERLAIVEDAQHVDLAHNARMQQLVMELQDQHRAMLLQNAAILELIKKLQVDMIRLEHWIGADESDGPFNPEFQTMKSQIEELASKVDGRNKSAATKRNMTDEDAHKVLDGDLGSERHLDAAEKIGLTYAQVYSCRLEYTFKHVHKALRDAGWKNQWVKK